MKPAAITRKRILLGHLASRGDCLYATAIARQIKADYPGCHLTWAIGSMCRAIIDGNPHVDALWKIPRPITARCPMLGMNSMPRRSCACRRANSTRHFSPGFFPSTSGISTVAYAPRFFAEFGYYFPDQDPQVVTN
jgi:hypothetical protein